ncbi:unnamed protein product [Rotaria sp. Silwood1]|nr:unnamed protein product [Rotaria sp. Silwood1]
MDDKVYQHMTRTGTYLLIQESNETDFNSVQRHLSKIVEELTLLLNDLRERQYCGFGQPLNHLLANIYMFYWQQDSVKILVNQNEIFGRYLNEIQLRTIINHDNDIEPHGLSFISDHPPVMYSTLIQVCLMRAALIRSKHELLSPTQVLTGQQQIQEPAQSQKGEEVKRKGKSRGDGKAQRRRGLLRRKGLDPD